MTHEQIVRTIEDYLHESMPGLEVDFGKLSVHDRLWDILGSLNLMSLVAYLESAFSIKVAPIHFVPDNFASIDLIAELIEDIRAGHAQ